MAQVASSKLNKTLKLFSSKLYKIRVRPLDFLVQNLGLFTTPRYVITYWMAYLTRDVNTFFF